MAEDRIVDDLEVKVTSRRNSRYYQLVKPYTTPVFPSVTTVLGVVNKPALVGWARKTEREKIRHELRELTREGGLVVDVGSDIDAIIEAASKQPDSIAEDAASIGLEVHKLIEQWIRGGAEAEAAEQILIQAAKDMVKTQDSRVLNCISGFFQWWRQQECEIVATELPLVVGNSSHCPGFGGTIDLLVRYPQYNRLTVYDFKTSNGIYPEYAMQVAAYGHMLREWLKEEYQDHVVTGGVVKLTKDVKAGDKLFETEDYGSLEMGNAWQGFQGARNLFKFLRGS